MICGTLILFGLATRGASGIHWWEADLSKEVVAIKRAVDRGLGQDTPTGYVEKSVLLPKIKDASIAYSRSGGDPAALATLAALVYQGRNAPGIESEKVFQTALNDVKLQIGTWHKAVDSLAFVKICSLFYYRYGTDVGRPPTFFIKTLARYLPDDLLVIEALVQFMTYKMKDFDKSEVINACTKLRESKNAIYTRARISGFTMTNVGLHYKDKLAIETGVISLRKYLVGMRATNIKEEREKWERWIAYCEQEATMW